MSVHSEEEESPNLWAQEECINVDKGYRYGDTDVYETFTADKGTLYRAMQREYGLCISRVYVDTEKGAQPIGWVFVKRVQYDDCNETFLCETWVTLHKAPPVKTIEYRYA
jgi:hypothetical protein